MGRQSHITVLRLGFATLALLCATLLVQAWASGEVDSSSPQSSVVNGNLNLASWAPERDGEIQLEGDWKFQWRAFLSRVKSLSGLPSLTRHSKSRVCGENPLPSSRLRYLRPSRLRASQRLSLAHDAAHYLSRDALCLRRD